MSITNRSGLEPMRPMPIKPHERWNFAKPGWLYQIKYDGFRALLKKEGECCSLYSKKGRDLLAMGSKVKALCQSVASELAARDIALDGELVALDEEGKADFWALMEGRHPLVYAAFDILRLDGKDVRNLPLTRRLELLRKEIPAPSRVLLMVEAVEPNIAAQIFELVCRREVEGLVAKRADSAYDPAARRAWVKLLNKAYPLIQEKRAFFNRTRATTSARRT